MLQSYDGEQEWREEQTMPKAMRRDGTSIVTFQVSLSPTNSLSLSVLPSPALSLAPGLCLYHLASPLLCPSLVSCLLSLVSFLFNWH